MPIKIMVAGSETRGVVVALMTTAIARKNASIGTAVEQTFNSFFICASTKIWSSWNAKNAELFFTEASHGHVVFLKMIFSEYCAMVGGCKKFLPKKDCNLLPYKDNYLGRRLWGYVA